MNLSERKAMTLAEAMTASVIVLLAFASVTAAYIFTKNAVNQTVIQSALSRDVNTAMTRIIRGIREGSVSHGLRSAQNYSIPSITRIDYTSPDSITRSYYLSGSSLVYESSTASPNTQTLFTAPACSTLVVRFWNPPTYTDNETVGIYISISRQVGSKTVSGSVSTYVNLRNVPK